MDSLSLNHAMYPDSSSQFKMVVLGFNTGMASGDTALKKSWAKDIAKLLDKGTLSLFTCANDHNDLKCELIVPRISFTSRDSAHGTPPWCG